ncbi:hypothetical protein PVAP13_4NG143742 [Panicum virgatum]|uniref:Uncharacterized protein n=1 Tax=Panicum virgatum TaxID=38727 RepID=A0A8T0TA98_PANVG|nr:hypothetical protein PVAP13_4NG143742 [Panicum virgatum]
MVGSPRRPFPQLAPARRTGDRRRPPRRHLSSAARSSSGGRLLRPLQYTGARTAELAAARALLSVEAAAASSLTSCAVDYPSAQLAAAAPISARCTLSTAAAACSCRPAPSSPRRGSERRPTTGGQGSEQ